MSMTTLVILRFPMGIAFAGGTPLQGSLGWGLSVINGGKSDTEDEEASSEDNTIQDITMEEMADYAEAFFQ